MNLYLRMKQLKMTPHEFLEQSAQIKIQLFLSFQPLMDGERLRIWSDMLQLIALIEVLIEEITRSEDSDKFQNSWAFWHVLQSANKDEKKQLQAGSSDMLRQLNEKYNSSSLLNSFLETNIEHLLARIQQVESESLRQEIGQIIEPLIKYQTA
jgi:heptaprenyl diphosphate synthase